MGILDSPKREHELVCSFFFQKALRAEREGNNERAEMFLCKSVAAEVRGKTF